MQKSLTLAVLVLVAAACSSAPASTSESAASQVVDVFHDAIVHFTADEPEKFPQITLWHTDNGREIRSVKELPPWLDRSRRQRIIARVATRPIPKTVQEVHDKWDRAGHVRLEREGQPPVEIVKFVTAYGGATEHEVDVTYLAPLLAGRCEFVGFVDTWSSPGWEMDFSLTFIDDPAASPPDWGAAVYFDQGVTTETSEEARTVDIDIPPGLERVDLVYLVSGHCTDGRDADEFQTKTNWIAIDGIMAANVRPWRDDCRQFRAVNPYCRRWSNGSWSSDYSRSGWCPSDVVDPIVFDLTEELRTGSREIRFGIDDIRPKDADGNHGYWRVSACLIGWRGTR